MSTCKDCLHYELCKRIDYELEYHNKSIKEAEEELPIKCRYFKNKSDVQEVKHGKWVEWWDDNYLSYCHKCSECGAYPLTKEETIHDEVLSAYCPNCGAKMDGGNNE
jgi:hypothetical protein